MFILIIPVLSKYWKLVNFISLHTLFSGGIKVEVLVNSSEIKTLNALWANKELQ